MGEARPLRSGKAMGASERLNHAKGETGSEMDRQPWVRRRARAGLVLVTIPLVIATILTALHWGRSGSGALSSAPMAALLLVMVAAGGLLLRGGLGSLRHLLSPVDLRGREGASVTSGVAIREQGPALVDGFGSVVKGAAESDDQMDRLHRQLRSIVEAQRQETAEAEGRLAGLLEASHAFGEASLGDGLGESILRRAAELTRARWGRLALLKDGENGCQTFDLTPAGAIVRLANGAELDSVSRRVIQSAKPLVIRPGEAIASVGSFAEEGRRSGFMIAAPLISGDRVMGVITLCERRGEDEFKRQDADTLGLLARQAALALDHANLYRRAQESYLQTTLSLVAAIEAKDRYLRGHAERVKNYSMAIARELEFDEKRVDSIRIAAELHDVGKVGIDLSVLNRSGPLTATELAQMRRHPEVGRDIVKPLTSLKEVGEYILQHHEWFNGAGYPSGLAGEQILLEARILAIADAFDAITSKRPYRPRRSAQDACVELRACAGTQFDPPLVEVAVRALTVRGR
ncbi:MAG TPA: HD domain-containing phosphohydrolase [Candidatus Methylomirabilis sp.]|nr:HD domain-containing phosphohydrolase [Candidatus Methylomirabilis sp.]